MKETREQRLSSWLDGEITGPEADRLFTELAGDSDLHRTLGRYHLVSDHLRGEPINVSTLGIVDRVSAALENEPVVLAPRKRRPQGKMMRYLGGGAIAASVALVAVLSLNNDSSGPLEEPTTVARAPVQTSVKQVADAQLRTLAATSADQQLADQQQVESQLDRILAEHSEYAGSGGMQGILPYTTFVSYDAR
jgi:sigma-E factor negative regulatory protein RseA